MENELKQIMGGFLNDYVERNKNESFSDWLADRLQQEMPDMHTDVSGEIINAVADYDRALDSLNSTIESGQSKEEWLADQTALVYTAMPHSEVGSKLQQINSDLNKANASLVQIIEDVSTGAEAINNEEIIDWNEYSVKNKALDVGRQAIMSGVGAAANVIKHSMENNEINDVSAVIGQALQEGMSTAKGEVKAVVAGAIKTAAEKGLTEMMPADTSVETICDFAGVAVETVDALIAVTAGDITMTEAMDKTGRASVAAVCRFSTAYLKGTLAAIPLVGPLVVVFAGGLLEHMGGNKFSSNVYTVVRDAAHATWKGIKQAGRNLFGFQKNTIKESHYNE
jgi:hypothetical protein